MEPINCKNCNTVFSGNYCPECGQKAKTTTIDAHYLKDEFKYTILHLNNGFFYTTKQLFTRPGHSTREFIEGKRIKHYKPVLFLFVLAGLYGFLLHYLDVGFMIPANDKGAAASAKMSEWMASHYSLIELIYLPITAFASWLGFRKWGYNYFEHLIINAYGAGLRLAVNILLFPILFLIKNPLVYMMWSGILTTLTLLMTGWLYMQFFANRPLGPTILRMILTGIYLSVFTILMVMIGMYFYLTMIHQPAT